jgi:hypothetical protein
MFIIAGAAHRPGYGAGQKIIKRENFHAKKRSGDSRSSLCFHIE